MSGALTRRYTPREVLRAIVRGLRRPPARHRAGRSRAGAVPTTPVPAAAPVPAASGTEAAPAPEVGR